MTNDDKTQTSRTFVIEVIIVGLVVFAVAVTIGLVTGAETGSVADWVAAIATCAAFIAAVFAARFAASAYELETERDERLLLALDRAQADKVAAWAETVQIKRYLGNANTWRTAPDQTFDALNASGLPVFNVDFAFEVRVQLPSGIEVHSLGTQGKALLAPAPDSQQIPLDLHITLALDEVINQVSDPVTGTRPPTTISVGLVFTDTGDRHWVRGSNGRLTPAPQALVEHRERERGS